MRDGVVAKLKATGVATATEVTRGTARAGNGVAPWRCGRFLTDNGGGCKGGGPDSWTGGGQPKVHVLRLNGSSYV